MLGMLHCRQGWKVRHRAAWRRSQPHRASLRADIGSPPRPPNHRSVVPATWCGRELGRKKGNNNEHGLLLYVSEDTHPVPAAAAAWECAKPEGAAERSACSCSSSRACNPTGVAPNLLQTRCTGVWECGSGCRSTACQINRGVRCGS